MRERRTSAVLVRWLAALCCACGGVSQAGEARFPPRLPGGRAIATFTSPELLRAPPLMTLLGDVRIAKAPPTVDFAYFPCQTYRGNPWSCWGDGLAADGKYYTSLGDCNANCYVYEYDTRARVLRQIADVRAALAVPAGHYSPGRISSRLDLGNDGWLYFATCRGPEGQAAYQGDWILRCHPPTGKTEVVVHAPVPMHAIPCSVLDPKRLVFYGGAVPSDGKGDAAKFFAYDLKAKRLLCTADNGPTRALLLAASTGRVYFVPGTQGPLHCYDPATGKITRPGVEIGLRSATQETPDGCLYTVAQEGDAMIWRVNPKAGQIEGLGSAVIAGQNYVASLDADPSGRYLYYVPGASGGAERDGAPLVQFDVRTKAHKVVAFLYPFLKDKLGYIPVGTFSLAVDPQGDKVYVTWNGSFGAMKGRQLIWDACALTVIHIPESERQP
ncbi:MAG TPA: hypothetical protein PLE19_13755 [Planctomycetota bacterium]|nr:hypothetical protein [Planctomycetota bacterium]HRR80608.1 hypothetical protein [Planctomycetota bacterium]HRT95327.1 hypothetical protein [Planctomycetota bacterium]